MLTKFTIKPLAMLAGLLLLLASCGTSTDTESGASLDSQTPAATAPPATPIPTTAALQPSVAEPDSDDHADADDSADAEDHDHDDGDHDHDDGDHGHVDEGGAGDAYGPGLDPALFFDGALVGEPTLVDCTTGSGITTQCYELTITGYPAGDEIGPFCPTSTAATAEEVGIWFDGDAVYDLEGEFVTTLAEIYGDSNWKLYADDGTVYVTDTAADFQAAAQPNVGAEYENYCVEGYIEWVDGGEPIPSTFEIPAEPTLSGTATAVNGSVGVTLNGVILEGPAPVDMILGAYTIAAFDDCGGHVNPVVGYHIHGVTGCSASDQLLDGETPMIGYALDGFPIYDSLDPAEEAAAGLDECNGHVSEELGYHYHANQTEENAILSCFMGEVATGSTNGPGPGQARPDGQAPPDGQAAPDRDAAGGTRPAGGPGGQIDLTDAALTLGVSLEELEAALGGPPPDFEAAAATLGISVEELMAAIPASTR